MAEHPTDPTTPSARRWPSIFLAGVTLAWAAALAAYAFIAFADPYELRFDRPAERLADHPFPEPVAPRLVSVAANEGADLVVVGGSTSVGYTPAMLRAAFPGTKRAVNLSYFCATDDDYGLTLPRLAQSKGLKRIIISLDFTIMWRCLTGVSPLDRRFYATHWEDPVPDFGLQTIALSRNVLSTGVLDLPEWRPRRPDQVDGTTDAPPLTDSPALIATYHRQVIAARPWLTEGPAVPCSEIPAIQKVIAPNVRRLAARGVAVDLVSPPYSLAYYGVVGFRGQETFAHFMALRRCALAATAGLPGVRFHAFDDDLPLVGALANYKDPGHLRGYAAYAYVLKHIVAGDRVLTPAGFPAFEARAAREVEAFDPAVPRPAIGR